MLRVTLRHLLAACLAALAAASLAPTLLARRLDARSRSSQWLERANAALFLAESPDGIPRLLELAEDPAPPVRANARWALRRRTGWDWEADFQACRSAWPLPPGTTAPSPDCSSLTLSLTSQDDVVHAVIANASDSPLILKSTDATTTAVALFGPGARVVRLLQPERARSGAITLRVFDARGRGVQISWISIHGARIPPHGSWSGEAGLSGLPPGLYRLEADLAEVLVAPERADAGPSARLRPLHAELAVTMP